MTGALPVPASNALLVARNPANRELLSEVLRKEGFEVVESDGVDDAHKRVETTPGLAVCLMDIGGLTPEAWTVCEDLSDQGVPVVVIAPSRTDQVHDATLKAGVHSVLEKPIKKANLQAILGSFVEE